MKERKLYMEQTINQNWRFHLGDEPEAWKKDFSDAGWNPVTLPHDWAVEGDFSPKYSSGTGYLPGGTGWYRGVFYLPESARGKKITLHFDGVYKNGSVWCNSYYLGTRPNGYIGYTYEISHCACFGEEPNVVSVRVEHEDISDSRWFTGSGITRGVSLRVESPLHFAEEGIVFSSPEACGERAAVQVRCTVENGLPQTASAVAEHSLIDETGREVWKESREVEILPGKNVCLCETGLVGNPLLWSPEAPHLYTLSSLLKIGGETVSARRSAVGIRTFRFDPDRGFFLNGRRERLKGVCVHHDAGCLGAAVRKRVWRRRLELLKEMGCNAIRMSHNPHMPELFDLCDEMGFFAIDEAFDEWEGCKNKWSTGHNVYPPKHQGYFKDFPQWGETDLRALIRRDRNHPSVLLWSVGNEVDYPNDPYCHPLLKLATGNNDANKPAAERQYNPNRPNMERLVPLIRRLSAVVREEDPTRPVTAALAFPEISSHLGCVEPLDVVGYNYKEEFYDQDHVRFPQKPFLGSENSQSYEAWKAVLDREFIAGQFLWTGYDFLGEAQGWPVHGSRAGLLTTAGFPKGEYWFRRSLWCEQPVVALLTARRGTDGFERVWTYAPGEPVTVRCCTNLPRAELFLNGRSLGAGTLSDETGDIRWETVYEEGELTVRADGETDRLETVGRAVSLRLKPWSGDFKADGEDVAQIEVSLIDGQGRETWGEEMLTVFVEGPAALLGLENGDQEDNSEYRASCRRTYRGKLLVYLLAQKEPGEVRLTVSGGMTGSHTLELRTEAPEA